MSLSMDMMYVFAAAVTSPVWGYRLLRTGKWRTNWPARFGRCRRFGRDGARRLLIHAVSVGEVNSVEQLVDGLCQADERPEIVISTTTDTGMARARKLYEPDTAVVRFPLDLTGCMGRFMDAVSPNAVALVENEVWPNMMALCDRRDIPVCVINGRLTERSHHRYRRLGRIARTMYGRLTAVAAQTQEYADRFRDLGVLADRVHVLDTMKWDTTQIENEVQGADALGREMGIDSQRPVIALGSTGETEERMLIDALLAQCPPQVQIVIVPRKPERFAEVAKLAPGIVRRTKSNTGYGRIESRDKRLFLVDTMGELRKVYALSDVVIVGRSFNGWGASDPIESIAMGKPTIIGPAYRNFAGVVDAFSHKEGIVIADHAGDAAKAAVELLSDTARAERLAQQGRQVIQARQGATARHAEFLMQQLHIRQNDSKP